MSSRRQIELATASVPGTHLVARCILAASGFAIGPLRPLRPLRQLLFFDPDYMVRLLATDPAAIVDVPHKAVVATTPNGVEIRILDPDARVRAYPGLEALGAELSAGARIVSRVEHYEGA